MRRSLFLLCSAGIMLFSYGCESLKHDLSHMKSSSLGLHRRVWLLANDGTVIKMWEGRYAIETHGSSIRFLHDGKVVIVNGTYFVEEI
jgi:hypothetical protein